MHSPGATDMTAVIEIDEPTGPNLARVRCALVPPTFDGRWESDSAEAARGVQRMWDNAVGGVTLRLRVGDLVRQLHRLNARVVELDVPDPRPPQPA